MTIRERCMACALSNTPANVRVVRIRKSLSGVAYTNPKSPHFGLLCAPRPVTRKALQVFLHECAHFALHIGKRRKRYLEEYEAEQWAISRMREAGLRVDRALLDQSRTYVARAINKALGSGARRIEPSAVKFARLQGRIPRARPKPPKQKAHMVGYIVRVRSDPKPPTINKAKGLRLLICSQCNQRHWASPEETIVFCAECELPMEPQDTS